MRLLESQALDKRMGSIIHGQKDESDKNVIFTQAFVNRHKAQVKGAFSALTRCVCDKPYAIAQVSGISCSHCVSKNYFY